MAQIRSQRSLSAVATANSKFITSRIDPNARVAEVDIGNYPIKAVGVVAQDEVIDRSVLRGLNWDTPRTLRNLALPDNRIAPELTGHSYRI